MLFFWIVLVFVTGAVVGSFLNVCIFRVPLEKSVFWPGSRCGHCYQPIRGYDNIPLVSYWLLRGRCRICKTSFSSRYFFVELLTALSFVGLFHLEVVVNVNSLIYRPVPAPAPQPKGLSRGPSAPSAQAETARQVQARTGLLRLQQFHIERGDIPYRAWIAFIFHAILLAFLIVVTFCDLDRREIPLSITGPGTIIGLIGSAFLAWPWPNPVETATLGIFPGEPWWKVPPGVGPKTGLYPWPVWGPLPDWLPAGSWQLGLATGLAGMLAGTFMLRAVGYLFEKGLGVEALGLGDADLMMMAGAFLGWQPVVVAFLVAVVPGLIFGFVQLIVFRDSSLPFGPSLAIGVIITMLGWSWIGHFQILFFNPLWLAILMVGACVIILACSYGFRLLRLSRGVED
jgi:leader peptidase (prepilin peptidase)/N-methyltransferase